MKRLVAGLTFIFLFFGSALGAAAEPKLSLGSVGIIVPGGSGSLALSLSGGTEPYAGINAKIMLPEGVTVTAVSEGELLNAGAFTIDWRGFSEAGGNGVVVIAYSGTQTFIASDGILLNMDLQVASDADPGTFDIAFATTNSNLLVNSKHALSNADGSTSVSHTTANGSITIQSLNDTDGDGLPDSLEHQIIDADPNDSILTLEDVLPGDDFDGDGESNLTEFLNGTDPTNPLSNSNPPEIGDVNNDGVVDLADAILVLQVLTENETSSPVLKEADVNEDDAIGVEELIFILRSIAGPIP